MACPDRGHSKGKSHGIPPLGRAESFRRRKLRPTQGGCVAQLISMCRRASFFSSRGRDSSFSRRGGRLGQHHGASAGPPVRKSYTRMRASATPSCLAVIITWSTSCKTDLVVQEKAKQARPLPTSPAQAIVRCKDDFLTTHHRDLAKPVQRSHFGCSPVAQLQSNRIPVWRYLARRPLENPGSHHRRKLRLFPRVIRSHPPPPLCGGASVDGSGR